MAAVYLFPLKPTTSELFPLKPTVFQLLLLLCHYPLRPKPTSGGAEFYAKQSICLAHGMSNLQTIFPCVTFVLLCKTLVLLCKTFIELGKTFLPLCKSLHCYVRSPKLPLVCLFAQLNWQLGRAGSPRWLLLHVWSEPYFARYPEVY